jgi:hypothetical protein
MNQPSQQGFTIFVIGTVFKNVINYFLPSEMIPAQFRIWQKGTELASLDPHSLGTGFELWRHVEWQQ